MGRGIELPEFADLGTLPAADGRGDGGVGFGVSQMVFEGPAADLGAVEGEVAQAQDFAGGEAVAGRRGRGEAFAQEGEDFRWPVGGVIAAGAAGDPDGLLMVSTGAEVVGVEFVEASVGQPQLGGCRGGVELAGAETGQDVTDQRRGQTMNELLFFIGGV